MRNKIYILSWLLCLAASVSVAQTKNTIEAQRQKLIDLDTQFDLDTKKNGADGWTSYFAPNGSMVLGANLPIIGPKAIHKTMQAAFSKPGYSLRWKPQESKILIPDSLGYTKGRYERRWKDKAGNIKMDTGTYVSIWKKQKDGSWKILLDTGETIPSATKKKSSPEKDLRRGYSIFDDTMADMTWPEIETAAKNNALVLLPLGVIEEHGPHIACGADIYLAYVQCKLIKQELAKRGVAAIIAPPFYWGINTSTRNFPGSFDMRPKTMKALLTDILSNLKHWGFKKVFYVNAHGEGGHNMAILESAKESLRNPGIQALFLMDSRMLRRFDLSGQEKHILTFDSTLPKNEPKVDVPDFHAGTFETSDMVAFFPDLVNIEIAKTLKPPKVLGGGYENWGKDARKVTPMGYTGDPSAYDANWARKAIHQYSRVMAESIIKACK